MATQAKAALQREDLHILADKGYFSALEILACHDHDAGCGTVGALSMEDGEELRFSVQAELRHEAPPHLDELAFVAIARAG